MRLVICNFEHLMLELLSYQFAHSKDPHKKAVWKKVSHTFTVHSAGTASQLVGVLGEAEWVFACVPHG